MAVILLGALGACGCLGAIFFGLGLGPLKDSAGAYAEAVAIARDNPLVQQELGAPIHPSFPRHASTSTLNGHTRTAFTLPLDGARANGTLHVKADEQAGQWVFLQLYVELEDGRILDLRPDQDATPDTEPAPLPGRGRDIEL
ncbi:cytochrome c oxidase assembly factor 1 family protein [Corallococcus sp. M34]|uniref:cytochrome c oxidase assembly factor Coa1 family protein n=1 Tax=Citreicoccus inhibens TaxID=2849499 RepID=UPI001C235043|nr:cytochrome c oxidase assembly factor Coa1 family protein [Citreicoccus inhibens]MBU8896141.1 cytochrome c oxidase assembly factor 1 family protein [Citreicoccus inhibens]